MMSISTDKHCTSLNPNCLICILLKILSNPFSECPYEFLVWSVYFNGRQIIIIVRNKMFIEIEVGEQIREP